jgi:uncharacterized protein (TIGR02001 family)
MAQKLQIVTAAPSIRPTENTQMKKSLLAIAATLTLTALPSISYAQFSANIGLVSDYRYRGISQTRLKPAIQGGLDYGFAGGFYVGVWATNIKWIKDFGSDGDVEIDLYGGWKGEIAKDLTLDVGVLTYQYPSNELDPSADTTELYGALTYGPATLKYSHAVTNTFANPDSKNSFYLDLSAGFDIGGGFTLTPHVGYQKIKGPFSDEATYTDYSLGVSKDFAGFIVSATVIGTDADKTFYSSPVNGKELGKATLVLGVKKTF